MGLAGALLAGACSGGGEQIAGQGGAPGAAPTPVATGGSVLSTVSDAGSGQDTSFTVHLSEGAGGDESDGESPPAVNRVEGVALGDEEISAVIDRLPPWEGDDSGAVDFNRPAESLPPPRTGRTVDQPFPAGPDIAAPAVDPGPLEVVRVQPEGEVGIAPFVSITFNQPMVPLTTLGQLDALDVPAEITPPLPGRWQWIGTRTLRFEHDQEIFDRLPMATSYTVEIPAGTQSQSGGELAATFRFEFETPPPTVTRLTHAYSHLESLGLEPVFLATFDQRVEPAAVLEVITLRADGREREIRLATAAEIEGEERVSYYAEQALEDTWVAFRPVAPLEPDTPISITVGPHVPSAEGPNTGGDSSTIEARTYAPLRVTGTNCSTWSCPLGIPLEVYFNNRLDVATVYAADITVTPGIPDAAISAYGPYLAIDGPTTGGAVYEVVIPATVGDEFGQTLGDPETVTFEIEEADPLIWYLGGGFATVDPLGVRQTTPVIVRQWEELRVRLYAVEPDDFQSYLAFASRARYQRILPESDVPWPLTADETIRTGIRDDALTEVPIDLSGVLEGGHGHVVMIVEGAGRLAETADRYRSARAIAWIQDTDIGVDLVEDGLDVVVWTTDLRSGDPLAGVEIQLGDRRPPLVTDADGLVRAATGADGFEGIVASLGMDRALSPVIAWESLEDQTIWHTADDRGMYRPGETVRLKGWVRHLDLTGDGGLEFLPPGTLITYTASGPFGNELGSGAVRTDEHGGFDLALELSERANLGWSRIEFRLTGTGAPDDDRYSHGFQVQEFRRPEFEVEARVESAGPHFIDEPAEVAVDARYFSGGALRNAEVTWWVTTLRGSYAPPNWPEFTFGVWRPWWWYYDDWPRSSEVKGFEGTTGADGSHYLRIDIADDGEGLPVTVTAEATVFDVNRQAWSSDTDFLVHSADLYAGIRSARAFVSAGDGIDVEAIVTDLDGNPVAGRAFEVTSERLVWRRVDGAWAEVALDSETCVTTSGPAPVVCEFAADQGGRYRISAQVVDDSGRRSRSEMTRWVSGAKDSVPSRGVELEAVNLVPDVETYAAGDTAEILVGSPFASATGLLTVVHSRIIETRSFEVTNHTAVLKVPIADDHVPELKLRVDLAAVTDRIADDGTVLAGVPPRPAHASGEILLRVPPVQRTLEVVAAPAAAVLQPGAATSVAVEVSDAAGVPVEGAGVLVIVVDEAVLALSGYELIDPIDVFYRQRAAVLSAVRGRDTILLEDLQGLRDRLEAAGFDERGVEAAAAEAAPAPADAFSDAVAGDAGLLVAVRQNLDPLALFEPGAVTDAAGRVTVEFELPDNLTRYRVMAVAVDGAHRFGTGESAVTARLPLQVRPSAPRFLNYGDRFELPIVVQNQTGSAMEVDVVVQTANLELVGSAGRRVTVPANDRVEVLFPARTESPGVARFRVAAISGDHADAQVVSLPVYTPATSEAFAVYGVVDRGAVFQPIAAPEDVIPQFGGLEVNTSSTALQALTDAVLYLADYRYASADAYAGRIMAVSSLRDVLEAFEAEGLAGPAELDARVRSDIAELSSLQNYDGGFGWLSRDGVSHPFSSIQAMHALAIASDNRFHVRARVLEDGLWYLQTIEDRFPDHYGQRIKDTLLAYALYVRSLHDDRVAEEARSLWARRGEALSLDALAWLWPVVEDEGIEAEIERLLNNRAVETAGAATFATDYGEDAYLLLHSDRRTDGIMLDALITMAPASDLIPKVVAGLLGHRTRGRWNNIQENTFILLALERYFETFEATDPDFVARVWLGDLYAAEHTYAGRSTDRGSTLIPMAELLDAGDSDLVVQKDGEGRLYYRLGLRYAPDDLDLEPLDRGFVVQRSYEAVGDAGDVWLDDDGVWHVRAGAEVRVNVTMVNDSRRTNMALIDPLPAGFEILNPALAVTGDVDVRDDSGWWWWTWYRHQNLRDDRAEAFASYLWAGTHEYSYVVRATTPGSFVVPPARAEEIYAPEVFGRSATDRVIVQESR
ncbi:MAG: hypothetical protein F4X49_11810 [Acidimicrobiia bacterium]|nr:hypothetical protein [Acidimicrobiia bacterium]